mmetsp:Transcript_9179/g.10485  ORF Transcript_9179/g.10485 Transcript_9179/m.10485 type:complete len:88 (-) Transcript_9179:566-829(-)
MEKVNLHLTCTLCGNFCQDASTLMECLHTFCFACITNKLKLFSKDDKQARCPECKCKLGLRPLLKPDHAKRSIIVCLGLGKTKQTIN